VARTDRLFPFYPHPNIRLPRPSRARPARPRPESGESGEPSSSPDLQDSRHGSIPIIQCADADAPQSSSFPSRSRPFRRPVEVARMKRTCPLADTSRCLSGQLGPIREKRNYISLVATGGATPGMSMPARRLGKVNPHRLPSPVEGANHKRTALSQINQPEMCFGPRGHAEGDVGRSLRTTNINGQLLPRPTRSALSDRRCSLVVESSPSKTSSPPKLCFLFPLASSFQFSDTGILVAL